MAHDEAVYDCPQCGEETVLELQIEGGTVEGTDMDGNRGWYVKPYALTPEPDPICKYCGHTLTDEEYAEATKTVERQAHEWWPEKYEPDPDRFRDEEEEGYL